MLDERARGTREGFGVHGMGYAREMRDASVRMDGCTYSKQTPLMHEPEPASHPKPTSHPIPPPKARQAGNLPLRK